LKNHKEKFKMRILPLKILIAGVGNLLRSDDGLGPTVIQMLKSEELPENVDLLDLGISGIEAINYLAGYDKIIFIDSIRKDGIPGTIYRIDYQKDKARREFNVNELTAYSSHEVDLKAVLEVGEKLGILPPNVIIMGCAPLDATSLRIGLSKPVEEALPKLIKAINHEVTVNEQEDSN
jgi:hydrogenase maturation protease